jgi:hypothetical protein
MTKTVKQYGLEHGSDPDGGGAGFTPDGAAEYREADNPASGPGTYWTPGGEHLAVGTPQVNVVT